MKKIFFTFIGASLLFGSLFITTSVSAQSLSLKDLVNLLVQIEVISKDKIPAVNKFLAELDKQNQANQNDEESAINLTSEQTATSTYSYFLKSESKIDRLDLSLNCDKSKVVVKAKGGWSCGDKLTFKFSETKNFTFSNVSLSLISGLNSEQKIEVMAVGYLGNKEVGRDTDIITLK